MTALVISNKKSAIHLGKELRKKFLMRHHMSDNMSLKKNKALPHSVMIRMKRKMLY